MAFMARSGAAPDPERLRGTIEVAELQECQIFRLEPKVRDPAYRAEFTGTVTKSELKMLPA